jgi:hypothetical protein
MRKLLVIFFAVGLFAACKNEKKDSKTDRTETDDYRNKDDEKEAKSTDYRDDDRSKDEKSTRDNDSRSSWNSDHVKIFVDNCAGEAVKNGLQRSEATEYCECMQRKLEVMYPDPQDVGNIDTESSEMKDMIRKCRGM